MSTSSESWEKFENGNYPLKYVSVFLKPITYNLLKKLQSGSHLG